MIPLVSALKQSLIEYTGKNSTLYDFNSDSFFAEKFFQQADSNLFWGTRTYLQLDLQNGGWSIIRLNLIQRIFRFYFGFYKNTRLEHVLFGVRCEDFRITKQLNYSQEQKNNVKKVEGYLSAKPFVLKYRQPHERSIKILVQPKLFWNNFSFEEKANYLQTSPRSSKALDYKCYKALAFNDPLIEYSKKLSLKDVSAGSLSIKLRFLQLVDKTFSAFRESLLKTSNSDPLYLEYLADSAPSIKKLFITALSAFFAYGLYCYSDVGNGIFNEAEINANKKIYEDVKNCFIKIGNPETLFDTDELVKCDSPSFFKFSFYTKLLKICIASKIQFLNKLPNISEIESCPGFFSLQVKEIRRSLRKMSKMFHPDKGGSNEVQSILSNALDCIKTHEKSLFCNPKKYLREH